MSYSAYSNPIRRAVETVRLRCMALGLPTWRASSAGLITDRPDLPGNAGRVLRGRVIAEQVATAAVAWVGTPGAEVVTLFPGCWLIPVPDEPRHHRGAMTLAMALGRECLDAPVFGEAAQDAGLTLDEARLGLRDLASHSEESARLARETVAMMLTDLAGLTENAVTIDGLTTQLTDSYETIDALYSIGRSMNELNHPERFVRAVCGRLQSTLNYHFVTARFTEDTGLVAGLRGACLTVGRISVSDSALRESIDRIMRTLPPGREPRIIEEGDGLVGPSFPQALAQALVREGRVVGALFAGHKLGPDPLASSYDTQLLQAAAGYLNSFLDNAAMYVEQHNLFMGVIRALTAAIDAKDRYTRGHSERVALVSAQLARAAGFSEDRVERVRVAGLVHDVGKIGVPEAVLCKQGKLTDAEFEAIKQHPRIGHVILRDIDALADVLPGVLHHHERFDGRGYPDRLRGEQIPMIARIIALADTFDAMSSNRSYRSALPRERVLAEIDACAGTQFDPSLAEAFQTLDLRAYDEMAGRHAESEGTDDSVRKLPGPPSPGSVHGRSRDAA